MLLSTHSRRREHVQDTYLLWGYIDANFYRTTLTTFLLNELNMLKSSRFGLNDYKGEIRPECQDLNYSQSPENETILAYLIH